MKIKKRAQQELVGFVLIVVVVIVAMMIFLVISVRNNNEEINDSLEISSLIDSVLMLTSECAIVYEPDYDSYEDLFKSCYKGDSCNNLEMSACDYLNESFGEILNVLINGESNLDGYKVEFFAKEGEGLLEWKGGNCSGFSSGAQKVIVSKGDSLIVRMRVCGLV